MRTDQMEMLDELHRHLAKLPYLSTRSVALYDLLRQRPNDTWLLSELIDNHGDQIYRRRWSRRPTAPHRAVRAQVKSLNLRLARWCKKDGHPWGYTVSIRSSRDDDSRQMLGLAVLPTPQGLRSQRRGLPLSATQRAELRRYFVGIQQVLEPVPQRLDAGHVALLDSNLEGLRSVLHQVAGRQGESAS